ncbi:MAG: hypothetical protein R2830_25985 [Saprospiraceae bacterium]
MALDFNFEINGGKEIPGGDEGQISPPLYASRASFLPGCEKNRVMKDGLSGLVS